MSSRSPTANLNPYAAPSSPYPYLERRFTGGSSSGSGSGNGLRVPRIFKRLFKFPQMDFEVAVWEMTSLVFAPRKVFRNLKWYKQTRNTSSQQDPAFPYLLSGFLFLTSLAWSLAYARASFGNIVRIALVFVLLHCIASCLIMAAVMFFFAEKLFGIRDGLFVRGGRRRGLFARESAAAGTSAAEGDRDAMEFGYCFDVTIRAFLPLLLHIYILQFLLLPVLTGQNFISTFLSNTLYLGACLHAAYIFFLGVNALPFLANTHLILGLAGALGVVLWLITTLAGWNASLHFAPVLWCGGGLRKVVGGHGIAVPAAGAGGAGGA